MSKELLKRLLETRANTWENAKAFLDEAESEGRDMTAGEDQEKWSKFTDELNDQDKRIAELTKLEERAAQAEEVTEKYGRALAPAAETREAQLEGEIRSFLKGERRSLEVRPTTPLRLNELRSLTVGTATAGGDTVPTSFYSQLMAHLIEVSGVMMAGPTVLNTSSGEEIQVPKTTAHSTAALVSEGGTISASDPTFGQVSLNAYKYGHLIQVSSELVTDTGVDLLGYLAMESGRAAGNALGADLVTGDGTDEPKGVAVAATTGVTGAAATAGAFTSDNLIDLFYSVIGPYRASPSCVWMMRDATVAAVRKLKDDNNQYLWQPSMQVGAPDQLLGKPIVTDPNVDAVAATKVSVLFGDFSRYFVRLVQGIRFERSDDYAFNTDLVSFRCLLRGDGDLVDLTGAVKAFKGGAAS